MAGVGIAGASMVRGMCFREISSGIRLYAGLAGASLAVALLWQALAVPTTTPQQIVMHFYQHVLRQIDGRACPSYPVCWLRRHCWSLGDPVRILCLLKQGA